MHGTILISVCTNFSKKKDELTELFYFFFSHLFMCFFFLWTKQTWKHFRSGTVEQLYDPNLLLHNHPNGNVKNEILRVVHIGLLCTQKIQSLRPTMSKALQMLTKKDDHLPAPTKPPFIDESMMKLTDKCEDPCNPLKAGDSASIATISDGSFCPR